MSVKQKCTYLQAEEQAATVLSAMGHHAEAAKTLRSLEKLQQQHGIDTSPTAHRLQEADSMQATHPMNAYLALGLSRDCSLAEESLVLSSDVP